MAELKGEAKARYVAAMFGPIAAGRGPLGGSRLALLRWLGHRIRAAGLRTPDHLAQGPLAAERGLLQRERVHLHHRLRVRVPFAVRVRPLRESHRTARLRAWTFAFALWVVPSSMALEIRSILDGLGRFVPRL